MLKNSIKASLRFILQNRQIFILNLIGLSVGIASCLFAYTHITHELSYDKWQKNSNNLTRLVVGNVPTGEGWVKVSAPIPPKLKSEIPEISSFARVTEYSYDEKVTVKYQNTQLNEENVFLADEEFLRYFDANFLIGTAANINSPNSILISESTAKRVFKEEDPTGKFIELNGSKTYSVEGVFSDFPANTHIHPDYLVSFKQLEEVLTGTKLDGNWGQFNYFAYLELGPNADLKAVESKIKSTVVDFGNDNEMKFEQLALQPLSRTHFEENPGNVEVAYDESYLLVFASISAAILFISFINFVNLTIAGSTKRIKEVGVRKAMGASRKQLVGQFVIETGLYAFFSAVIGMAIAFFVHPVVNNIVGSTSIISIFDPVMVLFLILLVAVLALSAGVYISFFVLSFHPVKALKGISRMGSKSTGFKNSLLIVQFVISAFLIVSSIYVYQQLEFLKNKNLGLDTDQIVTIQLYDEESQANIELLKNELNSLSSVISSTSSRFIPGETNWNNTVTWEGQSEPAQWGIIEVDEGFTNTYNINLALGDQSELQNRITGNEIFYIINQTALENAGFESPIGQNISALGRNSKAPIVAIAEDFNFRSLHNEIEPLVLVVGNSKRHNLLSLKIETNSVSTTIKEIESIYRNIMVNAPFEYAFADKQFERLYQSEKQTSTLISILTSVAILLALTGLYALLSFTVKEKTKELAIRKVLGIEFHQTLILLARSYMRLLMVGNIIGIPLAWYVVSNWLENFSYHISLGVVTMLTVFVMNALLLIVIVSLKVIETNRVNPVNSLRYE